MYKTSTLKEVRGCLVAHYPTVVRTARDLTEVVCHVCRREFRLINKDFHAWVHEDLNESEVD